MCRVIAVANQKGRYVPVAHVQRGPERKRRRVGKTTTCVNLGIGLARAGKKVLLVEADAQGSMAVSLGIAEPDELDVTLVNIMEKVINDEDVEPGEGIIRHEEGVDFIPANIELAGLETALVNVMSRETILRPHLEGGYEVIAGHRRWRACELAGLTEMPVIIREMDDDTAVVLMVDTNIQREDILPSEKAKAYRMKYEAMKHQAAKGRNILQTPSGKPPGTAGERCSVISGCQNW